MARCEVILNTADCHGSDVRTRCFACGNTACAGCSKLMPWYRRKRVRVCNDCQEEKGKDDRRKIHARINGW